MDVLALLAGKGLIAEKDIPAIEREADESGSVESALVARGISVGDVLAARGEAFKMPTRALGEEKVPFEVLKYVPEESATHYRFAPLGVRDGILEVGLIDPDNLEALDALNFISSRIHLPFKAYLIS